MHDEPSLTIQAALIWAGQRLAKTSESPRLDAKLLLCAILGCTHEYLVLHPQQALTDAQSRQFRDWVNQRVFGVPIAYLLGKQPFYDLEFIVTPDVLIPRPETEGLVERAIAWANKRNEPDVAIVDVGVGSGAIALTLAKHLPQTTVYGIDISDAVLRVARQNEVALGLAGRVHWMQGDLLAPLVASRQKFDLIIANLPYISTDEMIGLAVAEYEPHLALHGGQDGLDPFRKLLADAPEILQPRGCIMLEVGFAQGQAVANIAKEHIDNADIGVEQDFAALDRYVVVHSAG